MSSVRVPGSVYRRVSGRWAAVTSPVFDPQVGRRRRISLGTFETRESALEAMSLFNADRRTVEIGLQRVGDYLTRWLELVNSQVEVGHLARRTASGYEQAVRLHIRPGLGYLRMHDLNHLVVHRWLTGLRTAKQLSDRSVVRIYRVAHRAMADAPIGQNPMRLPKHLRPTVRVKKEIIRPTADEIGNFLTHTSNCHQSDYTYPLFRLAATTGMRCGELVGLAWSDVDLDGGIVEVVRSLGVDHGEVFAKEPKSAVGRRLVGLDSKTIHILRSYRARLAGDRLVSGRAYVDEPLGLELVFRVGADGALIRPDLISRTFTREWAHAGLRKGVTLHSLRHTMASLLVAEGFPLTEVAGRLGHSVEVLVRTYARDLDPKDRERRMVEAVSARF